MMDESRGFEDAASINPVSRKGTTEAIYLANFSCADYIKLWGAARLLDVFIWNIQAGQFVLEG